MGINKMTNIHGILAKALDLQAVVKKYPELFNLNKLGVYDKCQLLKYDADTYGSKLNFSKFTPGDKLYALTTAPSAAEKFVVMTDKDINKLGPHEYNDLLELNFTKYIRKEKFEELTRNFQNNIFVKHPEWVIKHISKPPKLTQAALTNLSNAKPKFVDEYVTKISDYTTDSLFWINMIKYNSEYKEIFLDNTKTLVTATDVREVIRAYPSIVKSLTLDHVSTSKLTCKEWVLLINSVSANKELKNWNMPKDMAELFKMELTVEMLSGKSKVSKVFQNKMQAVLDPEAYEAAMLVKAEENKIKVATRAAAYKAKLAAAKAEADRLEAERLEKIKNAKIAKALKAAAKLAATKKTP